MKYKHIRAAILALLLLASIMAVVLAGRVSIGLALFVMLLIPATLMHFAHTHNPLKALEHRLDEAEHHDGQFLFRLFSSGDLARFRRFYRWLPSDPRCRLCLVPFGGIGRLLRIKPSSKNTYLCTDCLEAAPVGAHEMPAGLLFADLRGFTPWSEQQTPDAVAAELTRFYVAANRVLSADDALVRFVGDQVIAIYLPCFPSLREHMPAIMVAAAKRLISELRKPGSALALPIGVGLHMGLASVGNMDMGGTKDFTAVGDVVNTAARLQANAKAGQILLSAQIYENAADVCQGAQAASISVKGKSAPLAVYVLVA